MIKILFVDFFHYTLFPKLVEMMAVTKVAELYKQRGLDLDATLDLHVMHYSVFEDYALRNLVIKQSRDPTFWHSVLTSGRLYNAETGKFDTAFEEKYHGKSELFKV